MKPKALLVISICLVFWSLPSWGIDGTWEIVGTMPGFTDPTGLVFDGTWIWATEQHAAVGGAPLYKIDPQTLTVVETRVVNVPNCCVQGLAWDGQYIWFSGDGYSQYRYNPVTSELLLTCVRPANPQPLGLAVVAGTVYATGWYGNLRDCDLMEFDPYGCSYNVVASLPSVLATGLAWTGSQFVICMLDHGDPVGDFRRTLYKYSQTGEQLTRYEKLDFNAYDVAWDGEYLWVSDYGAQFSPDGKIHKIKLHDLRAYVDIKPGSCPNPLNAGVCDPPPQNAKSNKGGVLPVAVLGTVDFDVHDVDLSTVLLEGVAPLRWSFEDVAGPAQNSEACECPTAGPDGYLDLTLKFDKSGVASMLGSVQVGDVVPVTFTGQMNDETLFEAADCVTIVGNPEEASTLRQSGGVVLGSAVPNPFNPVARISYVLPRDGFVELSVYDAAGRLVESLVAEFQSAGKHVVEWDAQRMATGIYFYRIEMSGFTETRKMTLVK